MLRRGTERLTDCCYKRAITPPIRLLAKWRYNANLLNEQRQRSGSAQHRFVRCWENHQVRVTPSKLSLPAEDGHQTRTSGRTRNIFSAKALWSGRNAASLKNPRRLPSW